MEQIHKRFTAEQAGILLKAYCQGALEKPAMEQTLGIGKTRFFALLRQYRRDPQGFSLAYQRTSHARFPASTEQEIRRELMVDKGLVEDPAAPISTYSYSAIRDRLEKRGVTLSLPTITDRAKRLGC